MKKELTSQDLKDIAGVMQDVVNAFALRWEEKNQENKSWWTIKKRYLIEATKFLVGSLDELINFVEGLLTSGKDKKQAVMYITGQLFDFIVVQSFPIWLKPFSSGIKAIIINIIISEMIDFIVQKYNESSWKKSSV